MNTAENLTPEELTLETASGTLAALAWGAAEGKPVLAFHGWLDNAATYSRLAPELPGRRVVALDMPGHGLSDWRGRGEDYLFVDWVTDVARALEALGWDRVTLMGHSMGAGIAALFAGTFPDRVDKLVMLEGLGPLSDEDSNAPARLHQAVRQRVRIPNPVTGHYPDMETASGRVTEAVRGMTRDAADILVARGAVKEKGGVRWRSDPRLRQASAIRFTEAQVRAFLSAIACPSLLVRATEGFAFDGGQMAGRRGVIRNLQYEEVPGGHHVHLTEPQHVVPLVQRFFES